MVFVGFGIAMAHKFLTAATRLWTEAPSQKLYTEGEPGTRQGLKGAEVGGELSPELLGVGFLIGPKIASLMLAGAFLSYLVLGPMIAAFGEQLAVAVSPAKVDLIKDMEPSDLKANYLRYIGAGAVAIGGIISMCRALPLIIASIVSGLRDLRATAGGAQESTRRTERDMSMGIVLIGSVGMVLLMMFIPALGLGFSIQGFLGAVMILVFGFLFVTVSSRLTGEIGSSSNPISGMTIATLLLTCIIFFAVGRIGHEAMLTALTVAAVVCIASSNGGTTSQDLKTGYLIGATPKPQQYAILVGALTSAVVIGGTMLALDAVGTHYTKDEKEIPKKVELKIPDGAPTQQVGKPHAESDTAVYSVVHVTKEDATKIKEKQNVEIKPGRYLVDGAGQPHYRTDIPIGRKEGQKMDGGEDAPKGFTAPQPQLFTSIIQGILGGDLEWGLFIIGALIAVSMELAGVRALPFAVGMYLPMAVSIPIFIGGLLRWGVDKVRGVGASEAETETSPGVLLSSGYIAGGTVCGLIIAFFAVDFVQDNFARFLDMAPALGRMHGLSEKESAKVKEIEDKVTAEQTKEPDEAKKERLAKRGKAAVASVQRESWLESNPAKVLSILAFLAMAAILVWVGLQRSLPTPDPTAPPPGQPDTRIEAGP
jgi:uncharacterized oligopeptide transporter (OPT) family protein